MEGNRLIGKYIRRNAPNILLLIILILLMIYGVSKDLFNVDGMNSVKHIDLLTINTIFIGFLFTTLGVLVGFLGNAKIANTDRSGYMDEYYNTIYFGLFFFLISAVCGLLAVFINNMDTNRILLVEQVTILFGISFFIKSIINLSNIIRKVRKNL